MDQGTFATPRVSSQDFTRSAAEHGESRRIAFQFTGNASEYFKIWAVNTLLTIATLGVYSAWAKVRTKQYFYRNTLLDGVSFDYLADPIPILKGRIIVAIVLGAVAWSHFYSAPLYAALLLLLFLSTPWVAVKSLAFNARNSAYRNIRFAFPGRVGEAFSTYFVGTIVYACTCGIGYPWTQWYLTKFIASRHYYGDLPFTWNTKSGAYYRTYLVALALLIPGYAMMFVSIFLMRKVAKGAQDPGMFVTMGVFFTYLLIPTAYLRAKTSNLLYNGLAIGQHRFTSNQRPLEVFKLYASNAVAIVFSLGLLIPWAKIRVAQYRADRLALEAAGDLRAEALLTDNTSALGEGMADLGDFDLGIGT